jgi:hypothetical protein
MARTVINISKLNLYDTEELDKEFEQDEIRRLKKLGLFRPEVEKDGKVKDRQG